MTVRGFKTNILIPKLISFPSIDQLRKLIQKPHKQINFKVAECRSLTRLIDLLLEVQVSGILENEEDVVACW